MVINNKNVMVSVKQIISQLTNGKVILDKLPPGIKSFRVISAPSNNKNEHSSEEQNDDCMIIDHEESSENNDEYFFKESDKKVASSVSKPYCLKCKKTIEIYKPKQKNCTKCKSLLLFKCMKCNKQYSYYKLLEYHIRNGCKSGRNFKCPKCNYAAINKQMLLKHFTNKHLAQNRGRYSNYFTTCTNCNKQFQYVMSYIGHLRLCKDNKKNEKSIDVEESKKVVLGTKSGHNKNRMEENVPSNNTNSVKTKRNTLGKENSNDNSSKGISQAKTSLRSPLKQIEDNKTGEIHGQYFVTKRNSKFLLNKTVCYCNKCKTIKKIKQITFHNMTPSEICDSCKKKMIFKCKKCNKCYPTAGGMRYHLSTKCCPNIIYNCLNCEYKTSISLSITNHIRIHHEKRSQDKLNDDYKCFKCNREYKTRQILKTHLFICGKKPHLKCKLCNFKTSYKYSFDRHMQNHPAVKKSVNIIIKGNKDISSICCSKCNKKFVRVKSDRCITCKNNLTFSCKICNKSFSKNICHHIKKYLKEWSHPAEKRSNKKVVYHECEHCTFKSEYKPNLLRHSRAKHPIH